MFNRDVHLVTSWDDKGPIKIQKALEIEFEAFISGVKDVCHFITVCSNLFTVFPEQYLL